MTVRPNFGTLLPNGAPRDPKRIAYGIQRVFLPEIAVGEERAFRIPIRFLGRWELFAGAVHKVGIFPHGRLYHVEATPGGIFPVTPGDRKTWYGRIMYVWVPDDPFLQGGILA